MSSTLAPPLGGASQTPDPTVAAPPAVRTVVLAGNPNSGKSTLFNALTGLRQKVGNYAGVTVEKKVGRFRGSHGESFELLDLPGLYSLQSRSPDEDVARDVLLGRRADTPVADIVLCVVDATNLERNLYLVTQLAELGLPLVVALVMVDLAERDGWVINVPELERRLACPVVPVIAPQGTGLIELRQAVTRQLRGTPPNRVTFPPVVEQAARVITQAFERSRLQADLLASHGRSLTRPSGTLSHPMGEGRGEGSGTLSHPMAEGQGEGRFTERESAAQPIFPRAEAVLLVSGTSAQAAQAPPGIRNTLAEARQNIAKAGVDVISATVHARYAWIETIVEHTVRTRRGPGAAWSEGLDAVFTHRVWGWLVFLGVMAAIFFTIFRGAELPMSWIESGQEALAGSIERLMPPGDLRDLLTNGVVAGVGGVVIFLPQILLLFFFIGLLEDTGYLARAAFIVDRLMSRVGLHGKSFVPMLSSFACAIPGVMGTRTIDNPRDRLVTILVAPLLSCSARLPVYSLMIAVMLPAGFSAWHKAGLMLGLYALGLGAAFAMAWLFRRLLFRGERSLLLLEMPPFRWPSLRVTLSRMWERASLFLRQAGTVILGITILIWGLSTYPKPADPDAAPADALAQSAAGRLGHLIEPLIAPLGYDWKIGIGILSSFAAREVFVGTMSVIYSIENGEEDTPALREAMAVEARPDGAKVYTPLVCLSLMVLYVLAMQCLSTVAVVRRETNSWRWPLFQVAYMTLLAWLGAFVVFQGGRIIGFV